ncbi:MAG: phosphatase PAP2 family protein [Ardenticatenaceae bacterium]|nr:phosphatase PAP2 family protein [Ardenticatenaceae bacterium]
MSASTAPWNEPNDETREAAAPIKQELETALADIDTPEKAEALVERLTAGAGEQPAVVVGAHAPQAPEAPPAEQAALAAETVKQAAEAEQGDEVGEAANAIEAAAAEAVALEGPAYEALAEAVQDVTSPALEGAPEKLERPRRYLRDAIMQRMSPFQKYDTALFLAINNDLPRTAALNTFFHQISFWFNGGWAWLIGVALLWPVCPAEAANLLKRISVPIWVATLTVEGPVKKYFRRRRPFINIVRAIVVGKKPGNWSFPSGHSAAAFSGAWMMSRYLPRWRTLWYTLALLVGFSRIYLGAHYPGDVFSGSFLGLVLAEGTRRLMRRLER